MIPLVPETKMVDIGKLISLKNLLVRKVMWFVLTTMTAPLILSHAFGANHMTRIACTYSRLPRIHSLTFWLPETALSLFFISTSRNSLTLPVSKTQLNMRNMGTYTFCNFFLTCSAFRLDFFQSNPERDKRPAWEKTHPPRIHCYISVYWYLVWNT